MNLDKEIRARFATPYPAAPHLMREEEGATERGILSFKRQKDLAEFDLIEAQTWPDYITLHASLSAILLEDSQAQAALTIAGRDLTPQPFYSLEALFQEGQEVGQFSHYKAVQITYKGVGHYIKGTKTVIFDGDQLDHFKMDLQPHQEIFRKDFLFQSEGTRHQREFPQDDFWLTVAPNGIAGERLYPLLAYGGYFKAGAELKKIEPIFALIKQGDNERTALQLFRASELQKMGIFPPRTQRPGAEEWIFCETVKSEAMMSLAGALISGEATLKVYNPEEGNACVYKSIAYEQQDPHANHLTITFKAS